MRRERPRRQSTTAHDRVGVQPVRRAGTPPGGKTGPKNNAQSGPRAGSPGPIRRFTGALFGVTRTITVDGVRYRERSRVSLEKSLGPRGKGGKAYEVRFPAGRPMTINATETRRYTDLMPDPALEAVARARRYIHPGERVLIMGSGTGAIAERVARWTGPHGGVVALEHDHESVRFARRRYAPPATSLERGGPELLGGELPGAFDAVIADQAYLFACPKPGLAWDEIWRVLAPEGRLIHVGGSPDHPASAPRVPQGVPIRAEQLSPIPGGLPVQVIARIAPDPSNGPGRDTRGGPATSPGAGP